MTVNYTPYSKLAQRFRLFFTEHWLRSESHEHADTVIIAYMYVALQLQTMASSASWTLGHAPKMENRATYRSVT